MLEHRASLRSDSKWSQLLRNVAFVLLALLAAGPVPAASLSDGIVHQRIDLSLRVEVSGQEYTWEQVGRFVLPGDTLRLRIVGSSAGSGWVASAGELFEADGATCWVAPEQTGLCQLIAACGTATKRINAFVMVPYDSLKNGYLKGVRIGKYPSSSPFPNFTRPRGFIMVTPEVLDVPVSARYLLRDFVPRQPDGFPRYMALREELLIKLELLTDLVQRRGYRCDKLTCISGFRPPFHNRRNRAGRNSAHIYGGAADLIVDANNDGRMDDLNRDGAVNRRDSKLLAGLVDELEDQHPELVGGCGWYSRTRNRGPFIHVDVRGAPSRWHQ